MHYCARSQRLLDCDPDELLLVARRIPEGLMDKFVSDPAESLEYLRQWKEPEG